MGKDEKSTQMFENKAGMYPFHKIYNPCNLGRLDIAILFFCKKKTHKVVESQGTVQFRGKSILRTITEIIFLRLLNTK